MDMERYNITEPGFLKAKVDKYIRIHNFVRHWRYALEKECCLRDDIAVQSD